MKEERAYGERRRKKRRRKLGEGICQSPVIVRRSRGSRRFKAVEKYLVVEAFKKYFAVEAFRMYLVIETFGKYFAVEAFRKLVVEAFKEHMVVGAVKKFSAAKAAAQALISAAEAPKRVVESIAKAVIWRRRPWEHKECIIRAFSGIFDMDFDWRNSRRNKRTCG